MPAGFAAAGAASAVVGGVVGNIASAGDRAAQRRAMKAALNELKKVGLPPDLSAPLILKELQRQGVYTPELEEDLSDTFAEVKLIEEDETLKDAQRQALTMMQQRGRVGLSAEDRAALAQVRNDLERDSQAKSQQIIQQFQARGQGGAGAELQALLQSGQSQAEQASQASMSLMGQAQQRALEAVRQSADISSGMRSQDYNVNAANTAAQNERNRFLAENSIARQRSNVGMLNQAQQLNLAEQQRIADYNAQLANTEQARQREEKGRFWDRKLGYGQAMSAAQLGQAAQAQQQAANTANMFANIGGAVGSGLTAYGQSQQNQAQNQKMMDLYGAEKGLMYKDGKWTKG
jgi:hypothetical protein